MKRTAIRGHALQYEGRAAEPDSIGPSWPLLRLTYKSEGVAYCECGAQSPVLPSTAARQRWHRNIHKAEVREQSNG